MELTLSCSTCTHYDGDGFCSLPKEDTLILGYIRKPESVVCIEWSAVDAPDKLQERQREPQDDDCA